MEKNIKDFTSEISMIIDQKVENVHPSTGGRYFYIQPPKQNSPMLLHHYRGVFFIDIHPDDYEDILLGKVSAHEYIYSANWQVGYFWGGGSMIGGGFYQPFDIIAHREEIRRYFKILSCRGTRRASGYMPTEETCRSCSVEKCPFSKYAEGNWQNEMMEYDPRVEFFKALRRKFEKENHGYTLCGFACGEIPDDEIWIRPNGHFSEDEMDSFMAYASESIIQDLLMREIIPDDWEKYAKGFKFRIRKPFSSETFEATIENVDKAFKGDEQEEEEKKSLMKRVFDFIKKEF